MKIILRLTKVFIISMLTLWIISNFPGLDFLYKVLGVTNATTKERIIAGISTIVIGIIFELFPYLIKKYVIDKIKLSVGYLQKNIPISKMQFKKRLNSEGKEEYQDEVVTIVFSLNEGTTVGYWILNKLNAKLIMKYNPEQFSTIKKDGNIIANEDVDNLLSRDSKGYICMNIFNDFSSVGDYSMDTELYIKPKHAHIDKSNFTIKIQANNLITTLLARACVEVVNNKLILKRLEE